MSRKVAPVGSPSGMVALLFTDLVGSTEILERLGDIHHDNFLPPLTSSGESYYHPLVDELAKIPAEQRPDLCFITDPESYHTIIRFVPSQWAGGAKVPVEGCVTPGT